MTTVRPSRLHRPWVASLYDLMQTKALYCSVFGVPSTMNLTSCYARLPRRPIDDGPARETKVVL